MKIRIRVVLGGCIVVSLALIAIALHLWGAAEVRASTGEVFFLTFVGAIWLAVASKLFAWLGLSLRDDVLDRSNTAALVAYCGGFMAVAMIYTGGSLGEGPSYWNNFFSAGFGTVAFFVLWVLLELGAKVSVSIAEERDLASGLRLGGFLLAIGLMIGWAVAGDWHSASATIHDSIHDGWPAAGLCAMAMVNERLARPSRRRPFPSWLGCGLLPALLYLVLAGVWVWHLGPWEGMPA